MATTEQLQDRIAAIALELAENELGELNEENALSWLDAVETRAAEITDAIAVEVIKQKVARRPTQTNESICPQCGKLSRYQGKRDRPLLTKRGPGMVSEPEYYCPCCRKAFFPDDQRNRG